MTKVFVLQAQGFGDSEDEFYNIGVFSTEEKLESALLSLQEQWAEDGLEDVETNVESWELDAR